MQNNPVGWFEIYVQDMERARKFYETVFKIKLETLALPGMEMLAFPMSMDRTGASGALVKMEGVSSGGSGIMIYFSCVDCATEAARIAPSGGRIHRDKTSIGQYGYIALAYDTEGNMIGLHSRQ